MVPIQQALWLDGGKIQALGRSTEVVDLYLRSLYGYS
jgi:ABC-type polysaccharide/polyol phosphate transport system ATPase subunit